MIVGTAAPTVEVMELRVGCPMWAYRAWHGHPLPERVAKDEQLAAYAEWCNAVEGNTTFYGLPAATTVASWADQAPADFRFLFKLPRAITHERRLRHADAEVGELFALLAPLGARAEQVSIQLPPTFGPPELGALAAFVRRLPSLGAEGHRIAVEVRHPGFFDGSVARSTLARVLADVGGEWIVLDSTTLFAARPTSEAERETRARTPRLPVHRTALSDRPIVRFIGRDDPPATVAGWQPWIPVVAAWLREGRTPTVFVHTPDNVDAILLARLFHDQVRAVVPELSPLPVPAPPPGVQASLF